LTILPDTEETLPLHSLIHIMHLLEFLRQPFIRSLCLATVILLAAFEVIAKKAWVALLIDSLSTVGIGENMLTSSSPVAWMESSSSGTY
jgi:hypothetical protein